MVGSATFPVTVSHSTGGRKPAGQFISLKNWESALKIRADHHPAPDRYAPADSELSPKGAP